GAGRGRRDPLLPHAPPRRGAVRAGGRARQGEEGARRHPRRDSPGLPRPGRRCRSRGDLHEGGRAARRMIVVWARVQWLTLKGRVIRSFRLLRQPKYLVGSLVGIGWISFWMIRPLLHAQVRFATVPSAHDAGGIAPAFHLIAALVVTLNLPLPWLLPWGRLGLPFRESELTMLLQAPLTRRQVIRYGLLKSEVGVVFGALLTSRLFAGRGAIAWASSFLGTCLLFEFWHLNAKWRGLFNLRQ